VRLGRTRFAAFRAAGLLSVAAAGVLVAVVVATPVGRAAPADTSTIVTSATSATTTAGSSTTMSSTATSSTTDTTSSTTGSTTNTGGTTTTATPISYTTSGGATFHSGSVLLSFSEPTDVSWYIEYGTTASYGSTLTQETHGLGGAGIRNTDISLTGLQAGTVYHFQAFVTAPSAWSSGDLTFSTRPVAPPVVQFRLAPACDTNT